MNNMPVKDLIFWGATGQAKVLRDCLVGSPYRLVAVFDNNPEIAPPFEDIPLLYDKADFENWLTTRNSQPIDFLIAIGGDKGTVRMELHHYLESRGLEPATIIHRTAFVEPNARIGSGSQILANATVCAEAVLGRECIINTAATVDHECLIGDGVHVAPGAHLAGCVEVGRYATIYTAATVIPRVKIGEYAIVGAGAVVLKDVPAGAMVVGNPARIVKQLMEIPQ